MLCRSRALLLSLGAASLISAGPAKAQDAVPPAGSPTSTAPPAEGTPADAAPLESAPVESAPVESAPAESAPAADASPATPAAPAAAPPVEVVELPEEVQSDAAEAERDARAVVCLAQGPFAVWPRLRLRTGYEFVQPDPELLTVGQNDGFFVDQARAGLEVAYLKDWRFRAIFEAMSFTGQTQTSPVQPVAAAARDLWAQWAPMPWLEITVGQQFMPVDYEGSRTTVNLPFARRSVAIAGVRAGHGYVVNGLSPTRQVGVVAGSRDDAQVGPVRLEYKLGLSNGTTQNILGNDNKTPALYARLGAGFEEMVRVGVHGRFNPRTVGTPPNLYDESDVIGGADVALELLGFQLVAQGVYRITSFTTVVPDPANELGRDTGVGATAWLWVVEPLGIPLYGFSPAYRISVFDPSSAFLSDQLLENSIGVRWDVPFDDVPVSLFLDATILTEVGDGARDLENNRITALVQVEL
jgi:hypothetical protein